MPAPDPSHWQQFQPHHFDGMHMDWRSAPTLRREPTIEPQHTLENAWLYGASVAALVFVTLWSWHDLSVLGETVTDAPQRHATLPMAPSAADKSTLMRRERAAAASSSEAAMTIHTPVVVPARRALSAPARRPPPQDAPMPAPIGKPDLDLMDAPSSPLEQAARYAARARPPVPRVSRGVPADIAPSMTIDPPHLAHGTLRINSRPWSQVHIDRHHVGNTPLRAFSLSAGVHNVCLKNAEFGVERCFDVHIVAGESITRVETLTD